MNLIKILHLQVESASFAYDGDTFCYSPPHIINRLSQYTDFQGTAVLLISLACRRCMGKDFYADPKKTDALF